jgi:hypothetical protein
VLRKWQSAFVNAQAIGQIVTGQIASSTSIDDRNPLSAKPCYEVETSQAAIDMRTTQYL